MSRCGDVPRVGVAGWPVAHSRSPIIHGYWLRQLGVAGRYERIAVAPGEFERFAARIGEGLLGSNVTAPHKEVAFAACDRRTPAAEALGAVNTLWRDGRCSGATIPTSRGFWPTWMRASPAGRIAVDRR